MLWINRIYNDIIMIRIAILITTLDTDYLSVSE
jgi:hypothetical protein